MLQAIAPPQQGKLVILTHASSHSPAAAFPAEVYTLAVRVTVLNTGSKPFSGRNSHLEHHGKGIHPSAPVRDNGDQDMQIITEGHLVSHPCNNTFKHDNSQGTQTSYSAGMEALEVASHIDRPGDPGRSLSNRKMYLIAVEPSLSKEDTFFGGSKETAVPLSSTRNLAGNNMLYLSPLARSFAVTASNDLCCLYVSTE